MIAENITIEDCMDMYVMKEYNTLVENGKVVGFYKDGEEDIILV